MLDFLFGEKVVKTTTIKEKTIQTSKRMYSEEDIKQLFESIISEIEIRKQNIISNSENMTTHLLEGGCIAFESSQDIIKEQFEQFKKK